MEKNSSSKNVLIFIIFIVVLVLVGALIYTFLPKPQTTQQPPETPYSVLTPSNYATGTTVSLYHNIPPDFPGDIVLENKTLTSSDEVSNPNGKVQISVSYISDKSLTDVANYYISNLPKKGWVINQKEVTDTVALIYTTKNAQNVVITITPSDDPTKSLVTFQYEK